MGRGEMGSVGRSVGQLDWMGLDWTGLASLHRRWVDGWAVGVPDSWDPATMMGWPLVLV